jgi:hypothetical protein
MPDACGFFWYHLAVDAAAQASERSRFMTRIRPVSDLNDYEKVLKEVFPGEPVFLTANGRNRYVIMEIGEYEKTRAAFTLMQELGKGEQSAAERGWIQSADAEKTLGS